MGASLLLMLMAQAAAARPLEHVHQPALPGFEQIVRQESAAGGFATWVPRGETLIRWRRMVTVNRFAGLALRTTPIRYLETVRGSVRATCPDARIGAVGEWVMASYPTAQIRVDCPRNLTTNRAEAFFMRAMAGYADLYVVQVTLRRVRSRAEFSFAERHMAGVMLCGPANGEDSACRAR